MLFGSNRVKLKALNFVLTAVRSVTLIVRVGEVSLQTKGVQSKGWLFAR